MEAIVDAAAKLAQGGVVLILVFLLMATGWACKVLFAAYVELSTRAVAATEAQTRVIETHTRALEATVRASDANKVSTDQLREWLMTFLHQGKR